MTERATPAPFRWPYLEHRNLAEVERDYREVQLQRPVLLRELSEQPVIRPHKSLVGKIWCKHCEINWAPKAVRACVRQSCPAKAELP